MLHVSRIVRVCCRVEISEVKSYTLSIAAVVVVVRISESSLVLDVVLLMADRETMNNGKVTFS